MFKKKYIRLICLLIISLLLVIIGVVSNSAGRRAAIAVFTSDNSLIRDVLGMQKGIVANRGVQVDRSAKDLDEKIQKSVIVIDAGHGGKDYGTCSEELYEKDINLDISLKLGELLEQDGIKVVYTRKTDEFIPLRERADIANGIGATLFISVHTNAIEDDTSIKGCETLYYSKNESGDAPMNSEKLAFIIQKHLVQELDTDDNGTISRPGLAVLRLTEMPAVIAEVGYISNPSDKAKLASPEFRDKAADGLYDAIIEALRELYSV